MAQQLSLKVNFGVSIPDPGGKSVSQTRCCYQCCASPGACVSMRDIQLILLTSRKWPFIFDIWWKKYVTGYVLFRNVVDHYTYIVFILILIFNS